MHILKLIPSYSSLKSINYLGIIVGAAEILSIYPLEIFTEIFGISQIVWFISVGKCMMRKPLIRNSN